MDPSDVTSSPVLVWISLAIGVLLMLAQAVPKFFGPIGKAIEQRQEARRRREREAESDKDRRIRDLQRRVWRQYKREQRWESEAQEHRQWDRDVLARCTGVDPPLEPGPPFMTPDAPDDGAEQ